LEIKNKTKHTLLSKLWVKEKVLRKTRKDFKQKMKVQLIKSCGNLKNKIYFKRNTGKAAHMVKLKH
jgi:hypothetical protein